MQVAFVKHPKHHQFNCDAFSDADQRLWFYLCFDMTEMSEIKLALFQTLRHGVPKLHHHGLLAFGEGANNVSMIQGCLHTKDKTQNPSKLAFSFSCVLKW